MTIQPTLYGILRPESLRTETRANPAGDYQHGNAKALRDDPEPMQPGTLDTDYIKHLPETIRHGFIKHLPRLRDHTARNKSRRPSADQKRQGSTTAEFLKAICAHAGTLEENLFCYRRPSRNF